MKIPLVDPSHPCASACNYLPTRRLPRSMGTAAGWTPKSLNQEKSPGDRTHSPPLSASENARQALGAVSSLCIQLSLGAVSEVHPRQIQYAWSGALGALGAASASCRVHTYMSLVNLLGPCRRHPPLPRTPRTTTRTFPKSHNHVLAPRHAAYLRCEAPHRVRAPGLRLG